MTQWIEVNTETISPPTESSEIHGVEIVVGLSPYDIPQKVRGYYDRHINRFVIEFKYLAGRERELVQQESDHISLVVGKESGCLYEIRVNVAELNADRVKLKMLLPEIGNAIQKLTKSPRFSAKKWHYEYARDVITKNAEQILAGQ